MARETVDSTDESVNSSDPLGAESLEDLAQRLAGFCDNIPTGFQEQTVQGKLDYFSRLFNLIQRLAEQALATKAVQETKGNHFSQNGKRTTAFQRFDNILDAIGFQIGDLKGVFQEDSEVFYLLDCIINWINGFKRKART